MTPADHTLVSAVLAFWFEEGTVPGLCEFRPVWFASSPEMDRAVRERFRDAFERAEDGWLDHLEATARGALALVILLDQFPRNPFRGQARAFASDDKAKGIAARAIARFDSRSAERDLTALQRLFLYLPFQHSEDLADQQIASVFDALRRAYVHPRSRTVPEESVAASSRS